MNVVHLCRAVLAAAILAGMSLQPAGAADAVSFRLDWTLSGYHLPFYWAKDKGYYSAENLDVDIKEGAGSGKTVALMSGQQDDIGLADYMFMSVGVAKGMKLKGIFGEVQDGAWAVVSRADSPIKKPEDLIGRSVATTADHKAMLDLLLAINKIPADKVKIQVTGAPTRNTVFVNGQVDSFISVLIGSPLDLVVRAQQGKDKPVYFMPFADFGIAPMGQGLLAHERVIAEKPEMLRRFVRASAKALNEIVKPEKTEEAVDVAMRLSGARDERRESVKLQWLETTRRLATKNTEGHPLGWMSDKDWAVSVDILVKTGQLEKPIQTLKVGSLGTHNGVGLAKAKRARFLLASTSEVYGDPKVHPQREDYWGNVNCVGPRGVYDEAKRFAEAMVMAYHRVHGLDARIVRIFNTYGPRMRLTDGRAIPTFVRQALRNEPMTVFGDGSQTRSFTYVTDLVEGIWALMQAPVNEPVNIGNPKEMTLLQLAQQITRLSGSRSEIVYRPLPTDDPKVRQPDITKARRLLKWEPKVDVEDGLTRTIDWCRKLVAQP